MRISLETLRHTKGIGSKTLEHIIKQHEIDNNIKSFESVYVPSDDYKVDKDINLWQGDCLKLMEYIPDKSIDMILCDLPYGTTACSWDTVIPFEPLWSHYKRIVKDNGVIVLFGSEPFSAKLICSNLDMFKYELVWEKDKASNFALAKRQVQKYHENILIFYTNQCIYNPIKWDAGKMSNKGGSAPKIKPGGTLGNVTMESYRPVDTLRYPKSILQFNTPKSNDGINMCLHPTQKPVKLLEYLIKTYTDENMLVLDNCMGSGSTGVACKNLNRKFIGIELDKEYFNISKERING